jgi:hypothetical protein
VEPTFPQHDETIIPVRPGLGAAVEESASRPTRRRAASRLLPFALGAFALAAAAAVFLLLPRWAEQSKAAAAAEAERAAAVAAAAAAPAQAAAPPLTAEEKAALQTEAQRLLADLLTQRKRLDDLGAAAWGGDAWQNYKTASSAGDDAYIANDFRRAVEQYGAANGLGAGLLSRSGEIIENALAAAEQAIAAGDAETATAQFDVVLGIEPEHAAAKAGRARAQRLPEVVALVRRGDSERDAGDLDAALESFRAALAIDPRWEPARAASAAVAAAVEEASFEHAMSRGLAALAAEKYADAAAEFHAALALRPQASEAQQGLTQAEQGQRLDKIALAEARSLAFEKRELWKDAIGQYRAVLATDPNLAFAQTGLERAQARAGLEAKLVHLIENPTLLFSDSVLRDARKLVDEASAQADRGPRLEEQIGKLGRLVTLASTPIPVELRSDQVTEVTLYRVGALGVFASKQVALRPGTYTAIGSRNGYRDVRQTFTVLPGRTLPPIEVRCVETI